MNSPTKSQLAIQAAYNLFSDMPGVEIGYSLANNRFQVSGEPTRQFIKELKSWGFWYDGRLKLWYLPQYNHTHSRYLSQGNFQKGQGR